MNFVDNAFEPCFTFREKINNLRCFNEVRIDYGTCNPHGWVEGRLNEEYLNDGLDELGSGGSETANRLGLRSAMKERDGHA